MNINDFLQIAVEKKASDLHLVAGYPPIIRIDGRLEEIDGKKALDGKAVQELVFNMLNTELKDKLVKEKELDIGHEIVGGYRFRVNLHWERGNVGLAARLIPEKVPVMSDINMPEIVYELCRLNQGLILMTGPTGCGKSTSLAAMINLVNSERRANIITLEDPVEFVFKPVKSIIRQRQLGTDMLSFAEGLKHVLRQDPNVVMVGEMRDLETIATAITLAETGHLILATLHTFSAAQTIDRIIDIFPPYQQNQVRMQVSMTLAGVVSQRLLPKKGGGRIAAREVLINNPAIANLVRENKIAQIKSTIQTSADEGMVTMDQALKELYEKDLIEREVAQAQMVSPEILD